jgi:hypothetical protein
MKLLKIYVLAFFMILTVSVFAQQKAINFISFSPSFTRSYDASNLSFPILVDIDYKKPSTLVSMEVMREPTYSKYMIPISVSSEISNGFYLNCGIGYGSEKYFAQLDYYKETNGNDPGSFEFVSEEVKSRNSLFALNLGKAVFLTSEKRIMIMPFCGVFGNFHEYKRIVTESNSIYPPSDSKGQLNNLGANLGVAFNFQLSKHFGLGLNFNDIIKYTSQNTVVSYPPKDETTNKFEFNFNLVPQLNLLFYFESSPLLKKK